MESYDYIIAGGGAAGLSLAYHLIRSDLKDRSILIVDKDAKNQNDRTWCFWIDHSTDFDPILYHSWGQVRFTSRDFDGVIPLGKYRYNMIRGLDFYNFTRENLSHFPKVHFLKGSITAIKDQAGGALVVVDGNPFFGKFVFDSLIGPDFILPDPGRYHYLKQHFAGWVIETDRPVFDPDTPILFDFRTPQNGAMRFMYILPDSSTQALVEYTLFSASLLTDAEYEQALADYLRNTLCISTYRVLEKECGMIPMTDNPFPRRASLHVLNIGTKGGRVKPSSGFAFLRIQNDSAAIVQSLIKFGHPFSIPSTPRRYQLFDSILLQIMFRHPEECAHIFSMLFKKNSPERLFRFLDERGPLMNDILLMTSLPIYRFIEALFRLKGLQRV